MYAGIAQVVEHLIRNEEVGGSSPLSGTIFPLRILVLQLRVCGRSARLIYLKDK